MREIITVDKTNLTEVLERIKTKVTLMINEVTKKDKVLFLVIRGGEVAQTWFAMKEVIEMFHEITLLVFRDQKVNPKLLGEASISDDQMAAMKRFFHNDFYTIGGTGVALIFTHDSWDRTDSLRSYLPMINFAVKQYVPLIITIVKDEQKCLTTKSSVASKRELMHKNELEIIPFALADEIFVLVD